MRSDFAFFCFNKSDYGQRENPGEYLRFAPVISSGSSPANTNPNLPQASWFYIPNRFAQASLAHLMGIKNPAILAGLYLIVEPGRVELPSKRATA